MKAYGSGCIDQSFLVRVYIKNLSRVYGSNLDHILLFYVNLNQTSKLTIVDVATVRNLEVKDSQCQH
jgi:hypothetical protein